MKHTIEDRLAEDYREQEAREAARTPRMDDYRSFKARQAARFREVAVESAKLEAARSVSAWDARAPHRYRGLTLEGLPQGKQVLRMLRSAASPTPSMFLYGYPPACQSLAYATMRHYVAEGRVRPENVLLLSETQVADLLKAGFAGREKLQTMLISSPSGLVFSRVGEQGQYRKDVGQTVTDVLQRLYDAQAPVLFTSADPLEDWLGGLGDTTAAIVAELVGDMTMEVRRQRG